MAEVSMAALVAAVRSGNWLISFPTDTVPALASRCDRGELIYAAKGRQPDKPLILMGAHPDQLWPFVRGSAAELEIWQAIAHRYWPGAVTLVLPAAELPPGLNPQNTGTIGLRVPAWPRAQTLLEQTGPLATTSINRSGEPPLTNLQAIATTFPQVLTLQGWELPPTPPQPSTVVQWQQGTWQILRQGAARESGFPALVLGIHLTRSNLLEELLQNFFLFFGNLAIGEHGINNLAVFLEGENFIFKGFFHKGFDLGCIHGRAPGHLFPIILPAGNGGLLSA